ncbi:MAG: alcohol dehydrogenase catalytic domain-containing protein [Lachnospiraceae bacterium]|nr:alcohol dehydrogenase catalytic domain-containing protein [Lachnospiraceae bacterium]
MEQKMFGVYKAKPTSGAEWREDLPMPECGENDVLIKVKATAICGTDSAHIYPWGAYAEERCPVPFVFGHEFAGEIVEVGEKVTNFKVGDRVAGETHIPCNHCEMCLTDRRHNCENMKIIGVHTPGSFAEYIAFPADCAFKIDDSISYEIGALLEPMGVGMHGVSKADVKGKTTVIYGCGPIGLMAVACAKFKGASKIIAIDVVDDKLEMAKKMGADVIINSKTQSDLETVKAETNGSGADVVIDYTGNKFAIKAGFQLVKKSGTMVLVGLTSGETSLDLANDIIYKEATVYGVTGRLMYQTWDECMEMLNAGFDLKPLMSGPYALKDFEQAFEAVKTATGRVVMIP